MVTSSQREPPVLQGRPARSRAGDQPDRENEEEVQGFCRSANRRTQYAMAAL
jgi:hypothetical protein